MKKRVTLKDVAEAVGVHVSTVSRALDPKTRHLITAEVAEQILKVSTELDYRQNAAAYSLKTNRTRTIGVVVPDITNPVFPPIIRGVEDRLAASGYVAILANTDGNRRREASITQTFRARGVDGLIMASVERDDDAISRLSQEGLPIVTVNRQVDDPGVSSVVNDEDAGMKLILGHVAGLGHRHVANIAGPQSLSTGATRLKAFQHHRDLLSLDDDPRLIAVANAFNDEEGFRCAEELLSRGAPFSAIVCSNDRLAIGAISALRRRGLSCPDDVSVTGYNDMPMVDRLFPALTTIRVQQYDAGHVAADILLETIDTAPERRRRRHVVLPVELVVRESTAAPSKSRNRPRRPRSGVGSAVAAPAAE
jgi:LacI family transcriptional regulator